MGLINWFLAEDRRTWIAHAAIAAAITLLASLVIPHAYLLAIGGYWFREIEELYYDLRDRGWTFWARRWFDHLMDVMSPTAAALLVGWLV